MEDYVLEAVAEKMLKDPAVKAEWEQKMKDPAFAKSPHERLDFFYMKHPSWDAQLGLVPGVPIASGALVHYKSGVASRASRYFAKKLFELTGFVPIGAFLIEHLYSNFQAVGPGGAQRFDNVVKDLQTNPIIIFLEIGAIGLPLLYHAAYGLFVASQARPNVGAYGYGRNWLYLFQRVTGVILLFYIGYHVWNTRLAPMFHPDNPLLQNVDGQPLVSTAYMHHYFLETHLGIQVYWIYVVGISCAVFHFCQRPVEPRLSLGPDREPALAALVGLRLRAHRRHAARGGAGVAARLHQRAREA